MGGIDGFHKLVMGGFGIRAQGVGETRRGKEGKCACCRLPEVVANFLSLAALLWLVNGDPLPFAACFMHDRHALGYGCIDPWQSETLRRQITAQEFKVGSCQSEVSFRPSDQGSGTSHSL